MPIELEKAWQELADFTKPHCSSECECGPVMKFRENRCCDSFHCQMTSEFAKLEFGVDLMTTGHPELPLMGPDGCSVAPHLRPWCTLHLCSISSLGIMKQGDELTKKYFELRTNAENALNTYLSEKHKK